MITILTIIHVVVCLFLIVIVLLQHGKGADIGATFGGSSQTIFGTEGPLPLLNKITTTAAIVFMVTSLGLAYMSANWGKGSVMQSVAPPPAPIEGSLERAPATIPMPESTDTSGQGAPAVSQEFPVENGAALKNEAASSAPNAVETKAAPSVPADNEQKKAE